MTGGFLSAGPGAERPEWIISLYFSLLPGNLVCETGSTATASTTNHSPHRGDFLGRPQIPTYWRLPARSTWSLDSRTLPRRTLWPFCLCTLKSPFPGNGDRLDLRLVRGWEARRRFRRYARRWLVERFFAWLQWQRRILVRWEYYPQSFLGFVQLACLVILLRRF
jgi:transposase